MRRGAFPVLVALSTLLAPAAALAAPGDPDPTFSGDGQLTTGFGTTPFHAADIGNAAARDPSGRIYIAGTTPANNTDFAVVRLTSGGVLDTTFGGGDGIVTTDVASGSDDRATAVLIDGSGDVVIAGTTGTGDEETEDFVVARYTSAGVPDSGFGGGDGLVTTDYAGAKDEAYGVALLGSGNIVVAGLTDTNPDTDIDSADFAIASYTSGGVLDTSFDGDGKLTTDFGSNQDEAFAVLATGSTFVAGGRTNPDGDDGGDFALARYSASTGALDSTFDGPSNGNGKFGISFSNSENSDFVTALAVDGSNRIIAAGSTGNSDFGVARLGGSDAAPDNTFDADGLQTVSTPASGATLGSSDQCYAVAVQADSAIVLGGVEYTNGGKWVLSRIDSNGTVDSGFGTSGIVVTDIGAEDSSPFDQVSGIFVDETNGKIIAAGTGNRNFAAARYSKSNGTLDTTFGPNTTGKVEADIVSPVASSETASGVAVQADSNLIVVGPTNAGPTVQSKGDTEFGVARFTAGGDLDAGFGLGGTDGNGRVTTNFDTNVDGAGTNDSPADVALQSDGKIVVAGTTDPSGGDKGDFAIARYEPDGDLDSRFGGGDGLVTTDFGGAEGDSVSGIAIEGTPGSAGFRIVVAGTKSVSFAQRVVAVAAYGEDGTLDPSFAPGGADGDGKQTTDLSSVHGTGGVALQPAGKVLVAATVGGFFPDPVNFALIRYDAAGAPDSNFGGGDGIVMTDFAGGFDSASSVAVRDLGSGEVRIVVAGRASDMGGADDGGIAAYTTDGSLDPSFGVGGTDGDGKLTFDMASNNSFDGVGAVVFQPDGKLVGSGSVESGDFGVVRVTSAGALDPSFGGDGLTSSTFPNTTFVQATASAVALQADGKIVAAGGPLNAFNGSDFFVARYGAPDVQPVTPPAAPPAATPPAATPKKKCKKGFVRKKVKGKKKCVKKKKKRR